MNVEGFRDDLWRAQFEALEHQYADRRQLATLLAGGFYGWAVGLAAGVILGWWMWG